MLKHFILKSVLLTTTWMRISLFLIRPSNIHGTCIKFFILRKFIILSSKDYTICELAHSQFYHHHPSLACCCLLNLFCPLAPLVALLSTSSSGSCELAPLVASSVSFLLFAIIGDKKIKNYQICFLKA